MLGIPGLVLALIIDSIVGVNLYSINKERQDIIN
jgi:hypothetical protein